MKMYIRTPHVGNEFKVCNEQTDEVLAIFFSQEAAKEYVDMKKLMLVISGEIEYEGEISKNTQNRIKNILK